MGSEWAAPLSALAALGGAVIGGGLSLFGGALTSRRQSADKRAELHQQVVASSREFVIGEIRTLLVALDAFLQVLREAEDISAQRAAAVEKDRASEAMDRALRGAQNAISLGEIDSPQFRSRPEFDLLFKEWRERVRDALPTLQDAVSSVEIAVPAKLAFHAETFLHSAESLVKSFTRSPGMFPVTGADLPEFTRARAALVREVRTWLFADEYLQAHPARSTRRTQ